MATLLSIQCVVEGTTDLSLSSPPTVSDLDQAITALQQQRADGSRSRHMGLEVTERNVTLRTKQQALWSIPYSKINLCTASRAFIGIFYARALATHSYRVHVLRAESESEADRVCDAVSEQLMNCLSSCSDLDDSLPFHHPQEFVPQTAPTAATPNNIEGNSSSGGIDRSRNRAFRATASQPAMFGKVASAQNWTPSDFVASSHHQRKHRGPRGRRHSAPQPYQPHSQALSPRSPREQRMRGDDKAAFPRTASNGNDSTDSTTALTHHARDVFPANNAEKEHKRQQHADHSVQPHRRQQSKGHPTTSSKLSKVATAGKDPSQQLVVACDDKQSPASSSSPLLARRGVRIPSITTGPALRRPSSKSHQHEPDARKVLSEAAPSPLNDLSRSPKLEPHEVAQTERAHSVYHSVESSTRTTNHDKSMERDQRRNASPKPRFHLRPHPAGTVASVNQHPVYQERSPPQTDSPQSTRRSSRGNPPPLPERPPNLTLHTNDAINNLNHKHGQHRNDSDQFQTSATDPQLATVQLPSAPSLHEGSTTSAVSSSSNFSHHRHADRSAGKSHKTAHAAGVGKRTSSANNSGSDRKDGSTLRQAANVVQPSPPRARSRQDASLQRANLEDLRKSMMRLSRRSTATKKKRMSLFSRKENSPSWLKVDMNRVDCHLALSDQPEGTFFVRPSSRWKCMVLSFVVDDSVKHIYVGVVGEEHEELGVCLEHRPNVIYRNLLDMVEDLSVPRDYFPVPLLPCAAETPTIATSSVGATANSELFSPSFRDLASPIPGTPFSQGMLSSSFRSRLSKDSPPRRASNFSRQDSQDSSWRPSAPPSATPSLAIKERQKMPLPPLPTDHEDRHDHVDTLGRRRSREQSSSTTAARGKGVHAYDRLDDVRAEAAKLGSSASFLGQQTLESISESPSESSRQRQHAPKRRNHEAENTRDRRDRRERGDEEPRKSRENLAHRVDKVSSPLLSNRARPANHPHRREAADHAQHAKSYMSLGENFSPTNPRHLRTGHAQRSMLDAQDEAQRRVEEEELRKRRTRALVIIENWLKSSSLAGFDLCGCFCKAVDVSHEEGYTQDRALSCYTAELPSEVDDDGNIIPRPNGSRSQTSCSTQPSPPTIAAKQRISASLFVAQGSPPPESSSSLQEVHRPKNESRASDFHERKGADKGVGERLLSLDKTPHFLSKLAQQSNIEVNSVSTSLREERSLSASRVSPNTPSRGSTFRSRTASAGNEQLHQDVSRTEPPRWQRSLHNSNSSILSPSIRSSKLTAVTSTPSRGEATNGTGAVAVFTPPKYSNQHHLLDYSEETSPVMLTHSYARTLATQAASNDKGHAVKGSALATEATLRVEPAQQAKGPEQEQEQEQEQGAENANGRVTASSLDEDGASAPMDSAALTKLQRALKLRQQARTRRTSYIAQTPMVTRTLTRNMPVASGRRSLLITTDESRHVAHPSPATGNEMADQICPGLEKTDPAHTAAWFQPHITRTEAIATLQERCTPGDFIVHAHDPQQAPLDAGEEMPCVDGAVFELSYFGPTHTAITHCIARDPGSENGYFLVGFGGIKAATLMALVYDVSAAGTLQIPLKVTRTTTL